MTNTQPNKQARKRTNVKLEHELVTAINNVDSVYNGIGIPLALHYTLLKSGSSVITVGTMGAGKGAIKSLLSITDSLSIDLDSVTKTDIAQRIGELENSKIHVNIEELAALSDYQRDILMTVLAKVITDRTYISDASHIQIINCALTMYCGIQPITFTQMVAQNKAWENLTSDRFIKIMLVNTLRDSDIDRWDVGNDWHYERQIEYNNLFRVELEAVEVEPKAVDVIQRLLMNQITGNRVRIYADKIMRAWASMNNSKKATVALANLFVEVFGFYFRVFDTFTFRDEVGANLQFKGALTTTFMAIAANQRFKYTKQDYVSMFRVEGNTWRRNVAELAEMGIIEIYDIDVQTPAGKRKAQCYRVSGRVEEFFKYYKRAVKVRKTKAKKSSK